MKSKIDNLVEKYSKLEKKYETKKKKNAVFKCYKCSEKFESLKDLQKHKEENNSCQGTFPCEECDKCFKTKEQLEKHVTRAHVKFECDECDKIFNYESTLEKHKQAVHEDVELYCHYFNNKKECPYDDQCLFLHEESKTCKYGKSCERMMCMFQHDEKDDASDGESEKDTSEEDESEEETSDIEPCLEKVQKSIEIVSALLEQVCPKLKCQQCEFEAKNQNGLNMHMKSKHTNKS